MENHPCGFRSPTASSPSSPWQAQPPIPHGSWSALDVTGDIERVFPQATVTHTPKRDYAYRSTLPRAVIQTALAAIVAAIDYTNFKDSVPDQARHDAYFACWDAMYELQVRKAGPNTF
jgi:hypothetical protein